MVVVDAEDGAVQQAVLVQPFQQEGEHLVGQPRLGEQAVNLIGTAVILVFRERIERVSGQRVDLIIAEVAAVSDQKVRERFGCHHLFIKRVAVDEEAVVARLQFIVCVVQRGMILRVAERLMHRAAVVEFALTFVERACCVACVRQQIAHCIRERAAAERIGDVAAGIGVNAGLRGKLGVEGVAVGVLRCVELRKVDALTLQACKRRCVFLVEYKIIHAFQLHEDEVLACEQAGHVVVLVRGTLGKERVHQRALFCRIRIRPDGQERVPCDKLVRPGQGKVVGGRGKPFVFVSARLPGVPVGRFGDGRVQPWCDKLRQHKKHDERRTDAPPRQVFRQPPHAQCAPQQEQYGKHRKADIDQLPDVSRKAQPLAREHKVRQE